MAKKTKDGLIVKGFKNLANRFSPEAEKYARYKIQKQKGTYKDPSAGKLPTEAKYRAATAEEKKSFAASLDPAKKETTKKRLPQKTAAQKKRAAAQLSSSIKAKGKEGKYKDAKVLGEKASIKAEKLALKKQKGSEAPKKQISKQDRRRSLRAADLAVRKGISLDEAKELQGQRRANRKQFLKNFAANLAGVEMNRGEFNTKDYENYKKNNDENAESNIVSDQQKSNKIDTENNTKRYKSLFESMANTPNSTLGNMSYLDDLEV